MRSAARQRYEGSRRSPPTNLRHSAVRTAPRTRLSNCSAPWATASAVGYAANASVAGVEIRDLRITLDGDIDLHTFLGLTDGHAGFSAIRVVVHLDTDADEATVAELHRKVAATSPVGQTLSKAIPVEITHQ